MRFCLLSLVAALGLVSQADAGFVYQFAINGNATAADSIISLAPGASIDVQVNVVATGSDIAVLNSQGLGEAGTRLQFSNTLATVLSADHITNGAGFLTGGRSITGEGIRTNAVAPLISFPPININPVEPIDNRVHFVTFKITAGLEEGLVSITTKDTNKNGTTSYLDGPGGTGGNLVILDSILALAENQDTITLRIETAAIPEPSSMALLGLGAFGLIARRIRGRKTAQIEAAV